MSTPILLATRNPGKIAELQAILLETGLNADVLGLADVPDLPEVTETGLSFHDNAALKASSAAQHCASIGLPVVAVADDSGLCVEVMGAMPGIFSARWAGKQRDDRANVQLVLEQLAEVPQQHWQAQFVCAAVACDEHGQQWATQASLSGHLVATAQGSNGFGYDPIFVPQGFTQTAAQLSQAQKNAISHRGQAFRQLAQLLAQRC